MQILKEHNKIGCSITCSELIAQFAKVWRAYMLPNTKTVLEVKNLVMLYFGVY